MQEKGSISKMLIFSQVLKCAADSLSKFSEYSRIKVYSIKTEKYHIIFMKEPKKWQMNITAQKLTHRHRKQTYCY